MDWNIIRQDEYRILRKKGENPSKDDPVIFSDKFLRQRDFFYNPKTNKIERKLYKGGL